MRREYVDNSVDGRYRAVRMQRRENEVSRFTDRQRGVDGREVAHFADENDVRILTQDILESGLESLGVRTHLSLVDDRHLVRMQVLDWILDRENVQALLGVDLVDDGGKRG